MGKRGRRRGREGFSPPTDAAGGPSEPHRNDVVDGTEIADAMTTTQLREQGVAIDLPFEAPESKDLVYSDGKSLRDTHPYLFEPDGTPEGGGSSS